MEVLRPVSGKLCMQLRALSSLNSFLFFGFSCVAIAEEHLKGFNAKPDISILSNFQDKPRKL